MQPLLPQYDIPAAYRPRLDSPGRGPQKGHASEDAVLRLQWLGVAGYVLRYKQSTLLIDPYVSRASLLEIAFRRLRSKQREIDSHIPPADYICVGHSHYDHLADVAAIVARDNAIAFGSRSTTNVLAREGIRRHRFETVPRQGKSFRAGDFSVAMVEGRHGPIFFGRVPYPGPIPSDVSPPLRAMQYRVGSVFGILVQAGNLTVFHNGTANLLDEALHGLQADVVILGLSGAEHTPEYCRRTAHRLGARVVIPTHYDAFFAPIRDGLRLLPIIDMDGFLRQVADEAPEARVCMPALMQEVVIWKDAGVAGTPAEVVISAACGREA